jgi:hypothetical protein
MPSYQEVRKQKALPIGSVMPWPGTITDVPNGWLFCNGAELEADEYPLLARILRDSYGGTGFDGDFPNYVGTFRLPNLNQKALADIGEEHFSNNLTLAPSSIDDVVALTAVLEFLGEEGDLGPPSSVFATTDILMDYEPDPDGFIDSYDFVGTGTSGGGVRTFKDLNQIDDGITTSGVGTGSRWDVILDNDGNYSVKDTVSGEGYAVGDTVTIPGSAVGGTTPANNIVLTVTAIGNSYFTGSIEGQQFLPGFDTKSVYVVPRKLGRNHLPQHIHANTYESINRGDSSARPGTGVGVWSNPSILVRQAIRAQNNCPADNCFQCQPDGALQGAGIANFWEDQTGESSNTATIGSTTTPYSDVYGRYALGYVGGSKPARTHVPFNSGTASHGIGKQWFTSAIKLTEKISYPNETTDAARIRNNGTLNVGSIIPFSDDTSAIVSPNYTASATGIDNPEGIKEVLYNSAAINPLVTSNQGGPGVLDVIAPHDHEGEFLVFYNEGSLNIKQLITVDCQPNVVPDSIPEALQITFNVTSPSLSVTNIIRAY